MSDFFNNLATKAQTAVSEGIASAKTSNFGQKLREGLASTQQKLGDFATSAKKKIGDVATSAQQKIGDVATSAQNFSQSPNIRGGRRKTHKYKGGNFRAHSPSNGLAAHAATVSGIRTASFKTVGGKRRRSNKHPCKKHHRNKHHHHTSKCRR